MARIIVDICEMWVGNMYGGREIVGVGGLKSALLGGFRGPQGIFGGLEGVH